MFENQRYFTKGITENVPLLTQIIVNWQGNKGTRNKVEETERTRQWPGEMA